LRQKNVQGLIKEIRNVSHLINLLVLDLSFNKIERIENLDQLVNLEKLYLASNRISEIEGLSNLRKLKVLELGSNKIRRIGVDALVNQTELEELWLGRNRLENMSDLTQFKFPKLSQLALQANKLTEWSTELFQNTAPNLTKVYLGNNGLPDPEEGVLMALNPGLLEDLDISYNRLTRVPNFTCNPLNKLQELWLNHNLISGTESFSNIKIGCPALLTVYLEGNPVQKECPLDYRNSLMDSLPDTVEKIDATMIPRRQINVVSSDKVGPHVHKTILKH
jgi:protein phosphatase 1 regulatory subunit 7